MNTTWGSVWPSWVGTSIDLGMDISSCHRKGDCLLFRGQIFIHEISRDRAVVLLRSAEIHFKYRPSERLF